MDLARKRSYRIEMQATLMVDANSGNDAIKEAMRQLWNDLYDNDLEDIFSVEVEELS